MKASETGAVARTLITLKLFTLLMMTSAPVASGFAKKEKANESGEKLLRLQLSTNQVTIGEKFIVSVLVEYALPREGQSRVVLPKIEEDWGALTLLNYEPQSKLLSQGGHRLMQYQINYLLVSYKVGRFQLPSFETRSYSQNGTVILKRTGRETIQVNSLLQASSPEQLLVMNPLAQAYAPFAVQGRIALPFLFLLLGGGVLIVLLSYLSLRQAKRRPQSLLPCEKALLSLEQLLEKTQSKTPAAPAEEGKKFHYALSFLVKEFLAHKYKARSLFPLTTQELKKTKLELPPAEADFYWEFLEYVDEVKFAGQHQEGGKTKCFIHHFKQLLLKEIAVSKATSKKTQRSAVGA